MEDFAARLKAARKIAGFTMRELANATNNQISQQAISRYEKEIMQPNPDNLLILTQALGVKIDFFLRENTSSIGKVAFRKIKRLTKKEEDRIKFKTIDFLERVKELEDIIGETEKFKNPIEGMRIENLERVEDAAEAVRKDWGLGENAIHSAVTTLENQHVDILSINSDSAFSGMASELSSPYKFMVINNNDSIKIDRLRFTIMHELGHMILPIEHLEEKVKESFTNRFSGALYIPKSKMFDIFGKKRKSLGIHELLAVKKEYGLSVQAIIYRAKDLKIINTFTHQSLMKLISQIGWRRSEPQPFKGEEVPIRLFRIINKALNQEAISTTKAASLLNISLDELNTRLMNFNVNEFNFG